MAQVLAVEHVGAGVRGDQGLVDVPPVQEDHHVGVVAGGAGQDGHAHPFGPRDAGHVLHECLAAHPPRPRQGAEGAVREEGRGPLWKGRRVAVGAVLKALAHGNGMREKGEKVWGRGLLRS